jgi:hypothetical protein
MLKCAQKAMTTELEILDDSVMLSIHTPGQEPTEIKSGEGKMTFTLLDDEVARFKDHAGLNYKVRDNASSSKNAAVFGKGDGFPIYVRTNRRTVVRNEKGQELIAVNYKGPYRNSENRRPERRRRGGRR